MSRKFYKLYLLSTGARLAYLYTLHYVFYSTWSSSRKNHSGWAKKYLQNVLTALDSCTHNVGSVQHQLSTRDKNMKLNVAKVIKDLGGATKIIEGLKQAGVEDITVKAIE